jgi:hypothetical protein
VLQLSRGERPAALELAQDVAAQRRLLLQELLGPLVALAARPALARERFDERQVLDRVDEGPPLEELLLLPEQPVEVGGVVRPEPAPEDEPLRGRDGSDRVDLQETDLADGVEDGLG